MANERKTESIVRKHFEKYTGINLEEQKSENPSINKLLKNASKKGDGSGYPEFIISFKHYPDIIIVIECKADFTKHESKNRDKYAEYAVDGVLLYASFLSKEYDVIAIGISGEDKRKLNISHFLHLKGEKSATPVFSDELLSCENYLNKYLKSPEKSRQDYFKLLAFTKELNDHLQHHKIEENKRSLLISGVLIALENKAFLKAYPLIGATNKEDNEADIKRKTEFAPKELSKLLVNTVMNQLKSANIPDDKLEKLEGEFLWIKNDMSLSEKKDVLKNVIDSIDTNINVFIHTHEYFDVLGQLYIEFLRYANSDKGLGIVLTPPHITELFADLANANKDSIIYDNCAGTGGFLISAMKRMIADAKGNEKVIDHIKKHQLYGVEYQSKIFALAVSNMFIHQDGKTNIYSGDSLDSTIIQAMKKRNPTIGLLNPPYKADKKKDIEELLFVLANLDCLKDGGTCVSIVPMQCALSQKGVILELKKKLLDKHTLEAVMSMPDELFFNSDVGMVTCIMVFTAHKPHPKNKETYFGYWKDDGFVKRKEKGRADVFGRWEKIKDTWLESYMNKKSVAGISEMRIITAYDEWCAEAYMQTDYSKLVKKCFEETILQYVTFLLGNRQIFKVSVNPKDNIEIELNTKHWYKFKLNDDSLFDIKGSKTTPILELEEYGNGAYPFVTTQATNNGVEGFYNYYTDEGNILTVDSAVLGYCSYQPFQFSASDHVEKLIPKFQLNKYIAMFLTTVLNQEQYRYNYGRKAAHIRLNTSYIKLPVKNGKPDFKFMENYIKSLPYSSSI
jgi:type I restriction-modification system DNA methylase subunit